MNCIKYQKKLTQAKTNKRIKAISWNKINCSICPTSSEGYLHLWYNCCSSLSEWYLATLILHIGLSGMQKEKNCQAGFHMKFSERSHYNSWGLSPDKMKNKIKLSFGEIPFTLCVCVCRAFNVQPPINLALVIFHIIKLLNILYQLLPVQFFTYEALPTYQVRGDQSQSTYIHRRVLCPHSLTSSLSINSFKFFSFLLS